MIVVPEKRALLLRARNPDLIKKVLPKHYQDIDHDGHNIAVKMDLEAMKVLRNMGIKAPSPIRFCYDWPKPSWFNKVFEHQLETSDFLTMNHRGFVLNEMGCVDANTEYLSPTGWRRMDRYDGGQVAQYDKDTGVVDFVPPTEYVKYPCTEMVRFKTERGIDQLLSAEHRVPYISSTGTFHVHPAHEIESAYHASERGWSGRFITSFAGAGGVGMPDSNAQLRLQIAVIADGHFGSPTRRCVVRVKKERKKIRMRHLLRAAGVVFTETAPEYVGAEGFSVFKFYAPVREKELGERWWAASTEQLHLITDEVWRWDGSQRKAGAVEFCSTSEASVDFIQYAFSACGRTATKHGTDTSRKRTLYVVHACAEGKLRYLKGVTSTGVKKENVWREPSPDGFKYCFEVPKTFLVMRRNGNVFITGNTSKTASALWAADYLMQLGVVKKALIVSPLSTLERVWLDEIFNVLMRRSAVMLHGSRQKRFDLLASDAEFYVINHDGLSIIADEVKKRKDINLVIVDEAAAYRNSQTARYKVLKDMLRPDQRVWLMTGTPCPNGPTDAWALARLISPDSVPTYFNTWRRQTMVQVSTYKWVPKVGSHVAAFNALQPAVRFRKADCLDLPPITYESRVCGVSDEQKQAYTEMKNYLAAEMATATLAGTEQITAVNAADKINKLRQILCGVVKNTDTGEYLPLDHKPRVAVLTECIEQASQKVLVIVPFKGIIQHLRVEIEKQFTCDVLNGDVSLKKRSEIIKQFKEEENPRVLLCHPKVMAHGLTLTEADTLIFYAPIYSNEETQQVIERINRPGQKHKMTIIRIGASRLEWDIYSMVEGKRLSQENILDMYRKELTSPNM